MRRNLPILLVCLAAIYYVAAGAYKASHSSKDFIPVYSGARCFIHGCNPYDPAQLEAEYLRSDGIPNLTGPGFWVTSPPVYPPSTFVVLAPLALLPFPVAAAVFALLAGGLFIAAVGLILWASPRNHLWVGAILAMVFAGTPSSLATGNAAAFSCATAMISTVLFLRSRSIPLATALLTISLATKPQIAGIIVLYFFVRGVHRRASVVVMAASFAILLAGCATLSARPQGRNWLSMLRSNVTESVAPGHVNDPSPANVNSPGLVNLQSLTSLFIASPKIYNAVAQAICLALFVVWVFAVRTTGASGSDHFLALPPLLVLSLLPVYHRFYDDLILLLAIPLILKVMDRDRLLGWLTAAATALPHALHFSMIGVRPLVSHSENLQKALQHKLFFIILLRQGCPVLLLLFGLYVAAMFAVEGGREQVSPIETRHAYSL